MSVSFEVGSGALLYNLNHGDYFWSESALYQVVGHAQAASRISAVNVSDGSLFNFHSSVLASFWAGKPSRALRVRNLIGNRYAVFPPDPTVYEVTSFQEVDKDTISLARYPVDGPAPTLPLSYYPALSLVLIDSDGLSEGPENDCPPPFKAKLSLVDIRINLLKDLKSL